MRRQDAPSTAPLALALSLLTLSLLALSLFAISVLAFSASAAAQPPPRAVTASVGSAPTGQLMAPGFVGLSVEYTGLQEYAGRNPRAVNPIFGQLLRNLAPAQHPVLRIGGDSTDSTWWPIRGMNAPAGVSYALTRGWLQSARALARAASARLILGVNLAADRPGLAAAEARAILSGIGRRYVEALEIGNEPDVYNVFPYYYDKQGRPVYARGPRYGLKAFTSEFSRWSSVLPKIGVAGPAFAELTWLPGLAKFIRAERRLRIVTVHRYPLRAGVTDPSSSEYPSIKNLLSDRSSSVLAQEVASSVATAHAHGLPFRVDEMNSASHFGQPGLSNTFASALWVLDTLFNLASVGTDGVNVHSRTDAAYGLFTVTHRQRGWQAFIRPEYYGMLMFEQAFPVGARLLGVSAPAGPLKVWATRAGGHTRVVVINKDVSSAYRVQLQVSGAGTGSQATLDWLRAPSVKATNGVSLGGQTFGQRTTTGKLPGPPHTDPVTSSGGSYTVELPAASAVLLTQ